MDGTARGKNTGIEMKFIYCKRRQGKKTVAGKKISQPGAGCPPKTGQSDMRGEFPTIRRQAELPETPIDSTL